MTGSARIALFGHGLVGQRVGETLLEMGCDLVFVHCHRAGSSDWQTSLSPWAAGHGLAQATDAGAEELVLLLGEAAPELLVSAYCRTILPPEVLACATRGGINLHGGPLPAYRGRAPVNWMVVNGERSGAAVLHVMQARADRGPVLASGTIPLDDRTTAFDLLTAVAQVGTDLLREALPGYLAGSLSAVAQQGRGVTWRARTPEDGRIDWTQPAEVICRLVRGVTRPYPGAFAEVAGRRVTVWWTEVAEGLSLAPGQWAWYGGFPHVGTGTVPLRLVDCSLPGVPTGRVLGQLRALIP